MRRRLRTVRLLAAALPFLAASLPVNCSATITNSDVCMGSLQLSSATPVQMNSGSAAFAITGTLGCTGPISGSLTLSGSLTFSAPGGCLGGISIGGSGVATYPGPLGSSTVTYAAVGPTVAQAWVISSTDGSLFEAAGAFTSINLDDIVGCSGVDTTSITITGALAMQSA